MFREGSQIGLYTLIRRLGRGGFGEVWLAEKRSQFVTKKVAVKLPHDDQINFDSIRQEATLWEEASGHPNVLPIIDADVYDGQVVIVSEYAGGGSLADKLKSEGRLPPKQAVEMTIGVLSGLDFLHRKKIIHRDIKPQNILLQDSTPRLADFGISRAMQTTAISSTIIGTDAYMAPESFEGKRNMQTDIWSVGVVLYQLLKGSLPFPQEHPSERMFAVLTREFEPLPEDVPDNLRRIVQKALAKNPEQRYQSAAEMRDDLQRALVGINYPTSAPTEILQKPVMPFVQPTSPTNVPPIETNAPSIQTQFRPAQTGKESGQYTSPAVETKPSTGAPSIVTQINPSQTRESVKSLPTDAQLFAHKKGGSRGRKKLLFYIGVPLVGLFLLSALAVYISIRSYKNRQAANSNSPSNATNTSNLPVTVAENVQLIPFRKGDKFGFSDANKKLIIEARYEEARLFRNGLAVVKRDGKYGFIDRTGKEIVPPKYDWLGNFYDVGLAYASIGGYNNSKCGYIDRNGNEVIPITNKSCGDFSEGLASLKVNDKDKVGYIDKTGKFVIQPQYDYGNSFSEGLALVKMNGKIGFINKTGKIVIQPKYDQGSPFSEGLALVNFGFINVIDELGKWGFTDKTGKIVIPIKYDYAQSFSEGLAAVQVGNKYGFIDKTGKIVIPLKYGHAVSFSEGLAYARFTEVENGYYKYGFIDKTDKVVIPFKYQRVESFENGFAKATLNDKEFYIDKNGTEYYEP